MGKRPIWKNVNVIVITAVLAVALLLMAVSRAMPRSGLEGRVAQETLAPDAVEILDAPEVTEAPAATDAPEVTEVPAATDAPEVTEAPVATDEPTATDAPEPTETPAATDVPEAAAEMQIAGPMPAPQTDKVRGYVVLTVNGRQYGDPIAMDRDKIITIRQEDGKTNRVHITPESVYMESSTCENQDCIGEGDVTLDNYQTRILGTWIICLPNAVTVEMVPAEEAE